MGVRAWCVLVWCAAAFATGPASAQLPAAPPQVGLDRRIDTDRAGFASSTLPQIVGTADASLHVVWQDYRGPQWAIYYRALRNFGASIRDAEVKLSGTANADANAQAPVIASDGDQRIYVTWHEFDDADERIMFARSVDNGASWTTPVQLNVTSGYASEPQICADSNGHVYVAWAQFDTIQDQIYLAVSADGGLSWNPQQRVNSIAVGHSEVPRIACDENGKAWIAYLDRRLGNHDVFIRTWQTGVGFGSDVQLDTSDDPAGALALVAEQRGAFDVIVAAWVTFGADADGQLTTCLSSNWSLNGGASWLATEMPIAPVACSGSAGYNPLFLDVDLSSSFDTDTGATYVHAAYGRIELPDQGTPTPTLVHYNQFTAELGTASWGDEVQVSFDGAPYPEKGPVFALPRAQVASDRANPENIFITWMHIDSGPEQYFDIHGVWSGDQGDSWTSPASLTTKPAGPGTTRSAYPQIFSRGQRAAVVWDDRRQWTRPSLLPPEDPYEPGHEIALGAPDVYFNIINLVVGP